MKAYEQEKGKKATYEGKGEGGEFKTVQWRWHGASFH
jgi:hypothetical protein